MPILEYTEYQYSKHSALGSRTLGINNDVNLPLETNMASSWLKCREKERHFVEQKTHFIVNFTKRKQKKLFRGENSKKKARGS